MVVKSATKKKLMDLGIAENFAHTLANDRKWDDVKVLSAQDIAQIWKNSIIFFLHTRPVNIKRSYSIRTKSLIVIKNIA